MAGRKEEQFWHTLQNLFVGVPVEGESGYINLMRLKTQYFQRAMRPALQAFIAEQLREFPEFREELFDKLYTFLKRYISEETGSIGFFFTPYHQSVYEQVYTDTQDVILFWKTQRLYYVKTDRLFRSMETEVDGFKFFFDASTLEHKKANEKRELVFEFKEIRPADGAFVFTMGYSERGRQTSLDTIRRAIRDALGLSRYTDAVPSEETLERAFRVFERQSEVDYFLCKDAKSFLREQFDLWMWQYLLGKPGEEPQTEWTETRLKQLQALKRIAYRVIDYIAAFEDELVKIWNKPKFVLNSNYVITLDRIVAQAGGWEVLEAILAHPHLEQQIQEWRELGMVGDDFTPAQIMEGENLIDGKQLNRRYQYLPIDTRYFKDLELRILGLFDHLDDALDGWLIKSENYQALNTILPKWQGKVQCIYIDPPFNKEDEADYLYSVRYKDSTWVTIIENRLRLARILLRNQGGLFLRCDQNGNSYMRLVLDDIFGKENFRNEIILNRFQKASEGFTNTTESLFLYSASREAQVNVLKRPRQCVYCKQPQPPKWTWAHSAGESKEPRYFQIDGQRVMLYPPKGRHWTNSQDEIDRLTAEGRIRVRKGSYTDVLGNRQNFIPEKLQSEDVDIDNNWTDIPGYEFGVFSKWKFSTENSETLLKRVIMSLSSRYDVVCDFFLGSGTTIAVAHKLRRRWIGVELGEHFYSVVLRRMKRVLYYDDSGISKEDSTRELYNSMCAGGFLKYYELEQFEDALRRTRYTDEPLEFEDAPRYLFLRDPKMTEAMQIEGETVRVALEQLYPNIDLAETLSNLLGKPIQRIEPDPDDPTRPAKVVFADGSEADLQNPDWKLIKPLIWW